MENVEEFFGKSKFLNFVGKKIDYLHHILYFCQNSNSIVSNQSAQNRFLLHLLLYYYECLRKIQIGRVLGWDLAQFFTEFFCRLYLKKIK
jgi:hypothetical protein